MFAKKKSLDAILSSFTKVTQDLRDLQSANALQAEINSVKIEQLAEHNQALNAERLKAESIENKLNSLLN